MNTMNTMNNNMEAMRGHLNTIVTYGTNALKCRVAQIALDHIDNYEEPEDYFRDVLQHGCQSGIVGELIYFYQTKEFFKDYCDDILELYKHYVEEGIIIPHPEHMDSNWLAWFGFEEALRMIADDLNIEY